jgi:hypothetical protein
LGNVYHRIVLPGQNVETDGWLTTTFMLEEAGINRPEPPYEPQIGDTVQVNWIGNMNHKMYGVVNYVGKHVDVDLGVRSISVAANFLDKVER